LDKAEDQIAVTNRRFWEKMVREGCGYTIPWLDLDISLLRRYAEGKLKCLPEPLTCMFPSSLLANVDGKDVLCLASGGGQQSAVFGLLGADVTVVDLTEGQLVGDRKAAAHYGYDVTVFQADMRDLAGLVDDSFDVVFQGPSIAYVPDVREVYYEVSRVLRSGGLYRVSVGNPATTLVEWNGEAYWISQPYSQKINRRKDGAIEFRLSSDSTRILVACNTTPTPSREVAITKGCM